MLVVSAGPASRPLPKRSFSLPSSHHISKHPANHFSNSWIKTNTSLSPNLSKNSRFLRAKRRPLPVVGPVACVGGDENRISVEDDGVPLEGVIQFEKSGRVAFLAGGDVLCLLVFAAIGRFNHGFPVFDIETFHIADPFIAGWLLSAYFLGGYGPDGKGANGLGKAVIAATKSWAAGIPLGLVIRAATSGHIPPLPFILVSMGSTAVLLIGWRAMLNALVPFDLNKKNEVYRRGNPFELFELLTSLVRRW
ncbi:uncharacterized protein LOC18446906 isoform X2 [Amborella trichopoda]|uniref:Transmembrane protein n=1 Tax=Amborella trichopoda TaxID=13333 RepID=U5D8L8_AMBTC|nr:uncharacterized protein LOC18446906 isoform X2 [Amborella trichopoda]ERN18540.1 hypothetical protein AMTR_s00065p00080270 [Amborella trichopoda]|eukprot:XP_006857073.1 uncharacterized protein LOC18446906 isoform X2 [Amborella trichopoda]